MHDLRTSTSQNSETLEPLTWVSVRPSNRYAHTLSLSLPLSPVLPCAHMFSFVSIEHQ